MWGWASAWRAGLEIRNRERVGERVEVVGRVCLIEGVLIEDRISLARLKTKCGRCGRGRMHPANMKRIIKVGVDTGVFRQVFGQ